MGTPSLAESPPWQHKGAAVGPALELTSAATAQRVASGQAPQQHRLVSARGLLVGLSGVLFISVLTPFNDYIANDSSNTGTSMLGSALPVALVLFFIFFLLAINAPLRRWWPRAALGQGELAKVADPTKVTVRHVWQPVLLGTIVLIGVVYLCIRFLKDGLFGKVEQPNIDVQVGRLSGADFLRFVGPALLIYSVFVVLPSIRAFSWSLHTWDGLGGIGTMTWAGLLHFKRLLFERDAFWIALSNNLFLMFVIPAFVVPLALALAACLSRGVFGAGLFRVVFFFPNLLGTVAVSLLWLHLYDPRGGLVNSVLVKLGLSGFEGFEWLSIDHLYWALIPMSVWGACGFNLVLYLAAMQGVPDELYEAADLEGASGWQQFWGITLPLIWDVVVISLVFLIIAGMKAFDVIWLLTNQRPTTATHVIGTRVVQTMFSEFNVGEATAMAVVLFILVFLFSAISMRLMRREAIEA